LASWTWDFSSTRKSEEPLFIPHAINAFIYHNSSFPHLAVYYAAKKINPIQVYYSAKCIFQKNTALGGAKGNYDLSIAGMPQLIYLLPRSLRGEFLSGWLKDIGASHFSLHDPELEGILFTTRRILERYIPFRLFIFYIGIKIRRIKDTLIETYRYWGKRVKKKILKMNDK
jgi:hypothetical protein